MESGEGVSSSAGLKQSIAQLQPGRQGQTGFSKHKYKEKTFVLTPKKFSRI